MPGRRIERLFSPRDSTPDPPHLGRPSEPNTPGSPKCQRCERTMVYEKFYGPHDHFWGWRCIWCGEIVDQIILQNRISMAARVTSGKTKKVISEQ